MNQKESLLRDNIRRLIRHVKQKKLNESDFFKTELIKLAKLELTKMLREASTPDIDPTPNKSTGINVLEELLKKIVPVLETDYKSLTTNKDQRESFRGHIVNAVVKSLTPAIANNEAGQKSEEEIEEEVDIQVVDDDSPDSDEKFIDIRTDAEKSAEEEPEDPRDDFGSGVDGDETGRNMAYQSFKKIESAIIDSYELLSNPEDQELFYDYLIANLKLYFNKFEAELSDNVEEPTNQAYDSAVDDAEAEAPEDAMGGGEEELELEL